MKEILNSQSRSPLSSEAKSRYFRLFPHCEMICGPRRAVIYDICRGELFHLNEIQSLVLDQCEKNTPIDEVTGVNVEDVLSTLSEATKLQIGMFYEGPVYVEKFQLNSSLELPGLLEPPPILREVYLQIASDCNLKCKFCGQSAALPWLGCNSCLRWSPCDGTQIMDIESIQKIVDELSELEVMNFHLSGGNPLLHKELLKNTVEQIRNQQHFPVGILIHTNGTGFDEDFLTFAREANLSFVFSLFGDSAEDYDHLCGNAAAFEVAQTAIRTCLDYKIPFAICVVLPQHDSSLWTTRRDAAVSLGSQQVLFTEFVTREGGHVLPVSSVPTNEPREQIFQRDYYFFRKRFNICLSGIMAIDSQLGLHPCPMIMEQVVNLRSTSIRNVIKEGKLKPYWRYTKSHVPVCKECELRFLCADCSVVERQSENEPELRNAICGYNPITGRWTSKESSNPR